MPEKLFEIVHKFNRRAIVMEIGGFRPTESPTASWFGKVTMGLYGERWPLQDGKAMHALAQINLKELPFRPNGLADIDFMTIFIGPNELPVSEPNGSHWVLRTYKSIENLIPLEQLNSNSPIKPFQMRPKVVEHDFPCFEDLPIDQSDAFWEALQENQFDNVAGFKLGGWPTLIQSEIYWAPFNRHPFKPNYVFQIDTTEKGNWMWGDNGVGYFGRGTVEGHTEDWLLEWQCF